SADQLLLDILYRCCSRCGILAYHGCDQLIKVSILRCHAGNRLVLRAEWYFSCKHLVEHQTKGKDVGSACYLSATLLLLRGRILEVGKPVVWPRLNEGVQFVLCKVGDAKVGHDKSIVSRVVQNILRLQISMDDAFEMGRFHAIEEMIEVAQDTIRREPSFHQVSQRALIGRHNVKGACRFFAILDIETVVDYWKNVLVFRAQTKLDFIREPLSLYRRRRLAVKQL